MLSKKNGKFVFLDAFPTFLFCFFFLAAALPTPPPPFELLPPPPPPVFVVCPIPVPAGFECAVECCPPPTTVAPLASSASALKAAAGPERSYKR